MTTSAKPRSKTAAPSSSFPSVVIVPAHSRADTGHSSSTLIKVDDECPVSARECAGTITTDGNDEDGAAVFDRGLAEVVIDVSRRDGADVADVVLVGLALAHREHGCERFH